MPQLTKSCPTKVGSQCLHDRERYLVSRLYVNYGPLTSFSAHVVGTLGPARAHEALISPTGSEDS